jgi:acetyl/propionyl-CoA carboxylase alpha subunit
MISKLVVWGEDRKTAVARMRRALDEYQVRGIETNLAVHRRCVRHAEVIAGEFDTGFIGRNTVARTPRADERELEAAIIAAVLAHGTGAPAQTAAAHARSAPVGNGSPEMSGWRRQLR